MATKFGTKWVITELVWEISPIYLRLVGGFGGWAIERRQTNSTTTNPCCHGNENLKQNRQYNSVFAEDIS